MIDLLRAHNPNCNLIRTKVAAVLKWGIYHSHQVPSWCKPGMHVSNFHWEAECTRKFNESFLAELWYGPAIGLLYMISCYHPQESYMTLLGCHSLCSANEDDHVKSQILSHVAWRYHGHVFPWWSQAHWYCSEEYVWSTGKHLTFLRAGILGTGSFDCWGEYNGEKRWLEETSRTSHNYYDQC